MNYNNMSFCGTRMTRIGRIITDIGICVNPFLQKT